MATITKYSLAIDFSNHNSRNHKQMAPQIHITQMEMHKM